LSLAHAVTLTYEDPAHTATHGVEVSALVRLNAAMHLHIVLEGARLKGEGGHSRQVALHGAVVLRDPGFGLLDAQAELLVGRFERIELSFLLADLTFRCGCSASDEQCGYCKG
jgi:hypothetical protein